MIRGSTSLFSHMQKAGFLLTHHIYVSTISRIDHWDCEKEKVVILTDNSLLIFKYNFINERADDFTRVSLHIIDTVNIGDFHYPDWSIMP